MANKTDYAVSSWRTVEIQQEVERGFDGFFLNDFLDWSSVKEYAYIVHDKDDTRPHIHCMIRFHHAVPTSAILKRCNDIKEGVIEFQQLVKCHSWKGAITYLTHKNAPGKYQYTDDAVVSNYDWTADVVKNKVSIDDVLSLVRDKILSGFSPYDVRIAIDNLDGNAYAKYKNKIEAQITNSNIIYENINKGVTRNMKVLFFYGDAATGKSSMAKNFAISKGYSFYISGCGKNMFDDYQGQDVIILDDLRDSQMPFSEFLKVLDNHIDSNVACRYNNKSIRWCKYIIVTTTKTPEQFYNGVTDSFGEEKKQILRRFTELWKFDLDKIYISSWDSENSEHIYQFSINNPVAILRKTDAEKEKIKNDLLSGIELLSKSLGFDFGVTLPEKTVSADVPDGFTQLDMLPDDLPF